MDALAASTPPWPASCRQIACSMEGALFLKERLHQGIRLHLRFHPLVDVRRDRPPRTTARRRRSRLRPATAKPSRGRANRRLASRIPPASARSGTSQRSAPSFPCCPALARREGTRCRRRGGQIEELPERFQPPFPIPAGLSPSPRCTTWVASKGGVSAAKSGSPISASPGYPSPRPKVRNSRRQQQALARASSLPCGLVPGPMQEHAGQPGIGNGKIGQHLADGVCHVEQHPAAGAAGNRRDENDLRSRCRISCSSALGGRGDRLWRNHRGNRGFEFGRSVPGR